MSVFCSIRMIPAGIAVGMAICAAYQFRGSITWEMKFDRWQSEELGRIRLNPRERATWTETVDLDCFVAHAHELVARPVNPGDTAADVYRAISQWSATWSLTPVGAAPGEATVIGATQPSDDEAPFIVLDRVFPGERRPMTLRVQIDSPAGVDAPEAIQIHIRNQLCGLERLPGLIHKVLGAVLGFIALFTLQFAWRWSGLRASPR